jgi:hypothetical protein
VRRRWLRRQGHRGAPVRPRFQAGPHGTLPSNAQPPLRPSR